MDLRPGILPKTTLPAAEKYQNVYQTTTLAGIKRSHTVVNPQDEVAVPAKLGDESRRALSFKSNSRLVASVIESRFSDYNRLTEAFEYSQRKIMSNTPTSASDRSLLLSHPRYGLPDRLVSNLIDLGIREIYPWQKHCLMGPGLLQGIKNLVYTAPTGGGKSLVADVLMLKRILESSDAKALLILPYVALVQEKVRWLRRVVQGLSARKENNRLGPEDSLWQRRADEDTIRVVGFFGGGKIRSTWSDFEIGVCTFEKANTLINTAIDNCTVTSLRAVILDEIHMIDDDHRGYLLELVATKLLSLDHHVQIIGMSATLPNIEILASWLDAHRYQTFYRPVPLDENLVYDSTIYSADSASILLENTARPDDEKNIGSTLCDSVLTSATRIIRPSTFKELKDPVLNSVVALTNETVLNGYGVLVFCSSRLGCESDAKIICKVLPGIEEISLAIAERRWDLLNDLRSLPSGLDASLAETIPAGVAFHHAGLTTEERDLVADAYDNGTLQARRVILHGARMGRDLIGPSMLRQMRGRAGRRGKDETGETYICCRKGDLQNVVELMHAELPKVSSGLLTDKRRIQRALLEVIAINLATSRDALGDYTQKTLLNITAGPDLLQAHLESSLTDLISMGFIVVDDSENYAATQLGKAVVASALEPEDGLFVHRELQRALRAFVMDGEMHILYTFTPVQDFRTVINWKVYRNEIDALDDSGLRVLSFLGLKPSIINKMLACLAPVGSTYCIGQDSHIRRAQGGNMKDSTPEEKDTARVYSRFYFALQLRDLCNETPIHIVARKFDTPRGSVQALAQTCQGFAAGMIKFCESMGWGMMAATLDHVADRLKAGARADLLELAKITFIKSRTARIFYDNGFKSVAAVANADPAELVPVLMQAQPTKVRLKSKDEQKYEEKLLAKAKVISESANRLWRKYTCLRESLLKN
ncbi:hypothetical protein BX600DRAFT_432366 [Xylariales sp. PMI_506]|nr:hypothetical protein BX600DRAFT_432366 [Xylariales sp. PMI_506]